jgi:hypothetical protein
LMSAGANQQLVANELQGGDSGLAINSTAPPAENTDVNGTLEVDHGGGSGDDKPDDQPLPLPNDPTEPPKDDTSSSPAIGTAESSTENSGDSSSDQPPAGPGPETPASRLILQPPSMGGTLTANSAPEGFDPSVDPLTLLNQQAPMLTHNGADDDKPAEEVKPPKEAPLVTQPVIIEPTQPAEEATPPAETPTENVPLPEVKPLEIAPADGPATDPLPGFEPLPTEPAAAPTVPADTAEKSLADLEASVDSPHLHMVDAPVAAESAAEQVTEPAAAPTTEAVPELNEARDAVLAAVNSAPQPGPLPPTEAAGAEGYLNVQDIPDTTDESPAPAAVPQDLTIPPADPTPPTSTGSAPSTAPPVPPPLPLDPSQFTEPKQ